MKKIEKMILTLVLVSVVCVSNIIKVDALTKKEFDIISDDIISMVYDLTGLGVSYFEEGTLPDIESMINYSCGSFDNNYYNPNNLSEYIVGWVEPDYLYGPKYKVPAAVFEQFIGDSFAINDEFLADFRENFKPTDLFVSEASYVEENGNFYYQYTLENGGFGTTVDSFYEFRGYKDLGNSNYQVYYYYAIAESDLLELDSEYTLPANPVEGVDYIMRNNYAGELSKYIILEDFTSKVYFNGEKTRLLSYVTVDKDTVPSSSELILPLGYSVLEGSNQRFDISQNKSLTFRIDAGIELFDEVYVDGSVVDSKNYEVTEGSTVITFTKDYSKSLKVGNHTISVLFTDGEEVNTNFTVIDSDAVENPDTGVYTGCGVLALAAVLIGAFAFLKTRKYSKFPRV